MMNYNTSTLDKVRIKWDIIMFYEKNYFEMKMGIEEGKKKLIYTPVIKNFLSKKKVDEIYAEIKELLVYEFGNCQNMVNSSLLISEKNQNLGFMIEMFVGASEEFAKMQTGDDENEGEEFRRFCFYMFLFFVGVSFLLIFSLVYFFFNPNSFVLFFGDETKIVPPCSCVFCKFFT